MATDAHPTSALPRVLAYPPVHPYVDRLTGQVGRPVPTSAQMPRLAPMYDPRWVTRRRHDIDIAHLHFGHEQHPVSRVAQTLAAHRAAGNGVVWTVHDLQVPHLHPSQDRTADLLGAVAPHVDRWVTLTAGAADEVEALVGERPTVIPHGPLIDGARRRAHRASRPANPVDADGREVVLVAIRDARPNVSLLPVIRAAIDGGDRRLRLLIHRRAVDAHLEALDVGARAEDLVDVVVHDGLAHTALEAQIAGSAALLLPYTWGTHSGLAELAGDLGVPCLVAPVGHVAEQVPSGPAFGLVPASGDGSPDLDVETLREWFAGRPLPRAPREIDRERAMTACLAGHAQLYDGLMNDRSAMAAGSGTAAGSDTAATLDVRLLEHHEGQPTVVPGPSVGAQRAEART